MIEDADGPPTEDPVAPATASAVPRFRQDLEALVELSEPEVAPVVALRATRSAVAKHLTGDASGQGFSGNLGGQSGLHDEGSMLVTQGIVTHSLS